MEITTLNNDIILFYVTATSFPNGILEAHQKLHSLIPFSTERKYFGLSRPEKKVIIYRAAAEEMAEGEAEKLQCETLLLKKGTYISVILNNYMKNIAGIEHTFKQLLAHPGIDPQGYCVEWYLNEEDVKCMVRLKE